MATKKTKSAAAKSAGKPTPTSTTAVGTTTPKLLPMPKAKNKVQTKTGGVAGAKNAPARPPRPAPAPAIPAAVPIAPAVVPVVPAVASGTPVVTTTTTVSPGAGVAPAPRVRRVPRIRQVAPAAAIPMATLATGATGGTPPPPIAPTTLPPPAPTPSPRHRSSVGRGIIAAGIILALLALLLWLFDWWPFNEGTTPSVTPSITQERVARIQSSITPPQVETEITRRESVPVASGNLQQIPAGNGNHVGNIGSMGNGNNVFMLNMYGWQGQNARPISTAPAIEATPKPAVWPENFKPDCREVILDFTTDKKFLIIQVTVPPRKKVSFITPVGWHITPRMRVDTSHYRCALNLGTIHSPKWVDMSAVPMPASDSDRQEVAEYGFESLSDSPIIIDFELKAR